MANCWGFHTWKPWSDPIKENWITETTFRGLTIKGTQQEIERLSQERKCIICGKYQKRYIEE